MATAAWAGPAPAHVPALERALDVARLARWLVNRKVRTATTLAEATTDPTHSVAQESAYEAARPVLAAAQVSAAIWVAVTINTFNRVSIMSKHPVRTNRGAPDEKSGVTASGG